MTMMSARFPGRCTACGGHIQPGDRIDWTKGAGARHVKCSAAKAPSAPRKAPAGDPGAEAAPFLRHEKWEPCPRAGFEHLLAGAIGSRIVLATGPRSVLTREGGSAPADGAAYLVVGGSGRYESAEQNEDMGDMTGAGWQVTLYLRRATDEEAAPARAEHARADAQRARAASIRELERLCEAGMRASDGEAAMPEGRNVEISKGVHGSGRKVAVLSPDGEAVAVWCSGYYDDYRQTLAVSRDPRAVEIVRALLG